MHESNGVQYVIKYIWSSLKKCMCCCNNMWSSTVASSGAVFCVYNQPHVYINAHKQANGSEIIAAQNGTGHHEGSL